MTLSESQSVHEKSGSTIIELWQKREQKEENEARKKSSPRFAEKPSQLSSEEMPGIQKIKKSNPKNKSKVKEIVNNFEEIFQPKENLKSKIAIIENDKTSRKLFPIFRPGQIPQVQAEVTPSRRKKKNRKVDNKANTSQSYGSIREHLILLDTEQSDISMKIKGTSYGIKKVRENKQKYDPGPTERTKISQDDL